MKTTTGMHGARHGFAITVVLLVTVVAVLAFLFSAATLTIASRSSAAQERNAAQALLAADSGLRTLIARAAVTPYSSADASFEAWIEGNFATLDLGDGVAASLDVIVETEDEITVQSTGVAGTSRRVVVQAFEIIQGPPLPASVSVPGALTSVGSIDSNSNPDVVGRDNTDVAWSYAGVDLCNAVQGDYVVDGSGVLYEVTDEAPSCGTAVQLEVVSNGNLTSLPGTTDVTLRPTAIAEDLLVETVGEDIVSTVQVTSGTRSLFGLGTPVSIGTGDGVVTGAQEDEDGNQFLTIDWTSAPGAGTALEGAVVRRAVASGVTDSDCDIDRKKAASSFPNGCLADQDLSDLFVKTFGITMDQMFSSLPDTQKLQGSDIVSSRTLSGITWVKNPDNNFRDQTGSGILIVENNPGQQLTLNVSNDFVGLIYVIGDAKIAGNGEYSANAIVVDGVTSLDVDVQGTTFIAYDPLAIMRAIAGITFPNPEAGGLGATIANTWRIR
jgi:hypothetical protein